MYVGAQCIVCVGAQVSVGVCWGSVYCVFVFSVM